MLKFIGCMGIAISSGAFSYAQQAVSVTSGNVSGSGGTASFTSGRTSYASYISTSGAVSEGTQPTFIINVAAQSDPDRSITLESDSYPNPATDYLILKIHRNLIENMKYQLVDLNGKILEEAFIGDVETSISLKHYKPTSYLLKVMDNSTELTVFNITRLKQP
jgi:hypothetical protein